MKCKGFKLLRNAKVVNFLTPSLNSFVASLSAPNSVLVEEKCIGCKKCDAVCPRGAIETKSKRLSKRLGLKYEEVKGLNDL